MKEQKIQFGKTKISVQHAFELLTSSIPGLKSRWIEYIKNEYKDKNYASNWFNQTYIDVSEISRFIIEAFKKQDTKYFPDFFDKLDYILIYGEEETIELMIVGLMESIQNIGGREINYYTGFDKWLKPTTKTAWRNLIDGWEGTEWRNTYGV